MRWGKAITVTAGTSQDNPEYLLAKLTLGYVERVVVYFPPGCLGRVHVALFHREHQFLPDHPKETISGDDALFDMALDYEITKRPANIDIMAWNEDSTNNHTIQVQVFIREQAEDRIKNALRALFVGGS